MSTLKQVIKRPETRMFRRLFIKRRQFSDGLFESEWQEVTDDVSRWGAITRKSDVVRSDRFKFNSTSVKMSNHDGKYSPGDNDNSLWNGYANQQRTLVRIEAGFYDFTTTGGVTRPYVVGNLSALFDVALFDGGVFDHDGTHIAFTGLLAGDVPIDKSEQVTLPLKPLSQVFLDYPAANLTGYTSTGMTAQEFMEMVRDQTLSGQYIFRPFFGDTTTNWNIQSTTVNYPQLNTSGAKDIRDKTVWDVMTKLAEAENFIVYISKDGVFNFVDSSLQTSTAYELYGLGSINTEYGHTIKDISSVSTKITNYYSRVEVQFEQADTSTSFRVRQATTAIDGTNTVWNLGHRALQISNFWIPTTTADQLADDIFQEVSKFKREVNLTTTFIPQLDVLNRVRLTYDSIPPESGSLWDLNDWDTELTWDGVNVKGQAFTFNRTEFKIVQITQDLDKFETKLIVRET